MIVLDFGICLLEELPYLLLGENKFIPELGDFMELLLPINRTDSIVVGHCVQGSRELFQEEDTDGLVEARPSGVPRHQLRDSRLVQCLHSSYIFIS